MAFPQTQFEIDGTFSSLAFEAQFLADVQSEAGGRMEYDQIGTSAGSEVINLVRLGYPLAPTYAELANRHPLMVVATQHGDEKAGREAALAWLRDLAETTDPDLLAILETRGVVVIPTANPDGVAGDKRNNDNGVDINRHHISLAHPETVAIQEVIRDARPVLGLDLHENPSGGSDIMELLDNELSNALPDVDTLSGSLYAAVGAAIVASGESWSRYSGGLGQPRTLLSMYAARGVPALLTESSRPLAIADRVAAQGVALVATMDWYADNAAALVALAESVRADHITKGDEQTSFVVDGTTVDPAPVGYQITAADFSTLANQRTVLELGAYQISGDSDYYVPMSQDHEPIVPWILDAASTVGVLTGTQLSAVPVTTDIAYRAQYSEDGGTTWVTFQQWAAGELAQDLDTAPLPGGALQIRVQARHAAEPLDESGFDTVNVANAGIEYEADYSTDDGQTWIPLQAWADDLTEDLDTTELPDGSLMIRVRARDAAATSDVSPYDTVSVTVSQAVGGGSATAVDVASSGGGSKRVAGGSSAGVGIAAAATGLKHALLGAAAVLAVAVSADGLKQAAGGQAAAVDVVATGAGGTGGSGGGAVAVDVAAAGAGEKRTAGGSTVALEASTTGVGEKRALAGSLTTTEVGATGSGTKTGSGGVPAAVDVLAAGGGIQEQKEAGGSAVAVEVVAAATGARGTSGGAETAIEIATAGDGTKVARGGSAVAVEAAGAGAGTRYAAGGSVATVDAVAAGGGERVLEWVVTAENTVRAEHFGTTARAEHFQTTVRAGRT